MIVAGWTGIQCDIWSSTPDAQDPTLQNYRTKWTFSKSGSTTVTYGGATDLNHAWPSVVFVPPDAGTWTVAVVITAPDGTTTATDSDTFDVQAFAGTTYYWSSSGSDANDGLSTGAPKLTLSSIITAIGTPSADNPPMILAKRGDTITMAAANFSLPKPCLCGTYDSGADPILDFGASTTHSIAVASIAGWGRSVIIYDWDVRRNTASATYLLQNSGADGSQFWNCSVTNGGMNFTGQKSGCGVSGCTGSGGLAMGVFSNGGWAFAIDSTMTDFGDDATGEHEFYITDPGGAGHAHVKGCTGIRITATSNHGIKVVDFVGAYLSDCVAQGGRHAMNLGLNNTGTGLLPDKVLVENCSIIATGHTGQSSGIQIRDTVNSASSPGRAADHYAIVIRNFKVRQANLSAGSGNGIFWINSFGGANELVGNILIDGVSAADNTLPLLFGPNGNHDQIVVRNVAATMPASHARAFYDAGALDQTKIDSDYNVFFASGETSASDTFAITDASTPSRESLDDWVAETGNDTHSVFADPAFADGAVGDFTITATSPCYNTGVATARKGDFAGTAIPQGSAPDIGTFEVLIAAAGVSADFYLPLRRLGLDRARL